MWTRLYFKEKVEFWKEENNNLRALSLYYAQTQTQTQSVGEHEIKKMFTEKHGSLNALII